MPPRKPWYVRLAIFVGRILAIDLAAFGVATLSCQFGARCTTDQWSDRMFWLALIVMLAAAPVVFAALSTGRGYFNSPFTAGPDSAIAVDIINRERRELMGRMSYMATMLIAGAIAIGISALITYLGK